MLQVFFAGSFLKAWEKNPASEDTGGKIWNKSDCYFFDTLTA